MLIQEGKALIDIVVLLLSFGELPLVTPTACEIRGVRGGGDESVGHYCADWSSSLLRSGLQDIAGKALLGGGFRARTHWRLDGAGPGFVGLECTWHMYDK